MYRLKKKINTKGIILIEALIALAVIVIVITALVTALVSAINSTTFSNEQTAATAYAQEGIDLARAEKNYNFSGFQTYSGFVNFGESKTFGGSCSLDGGKYCRKIYVNQNGTDARTSPSVQACEQSWSDGTITKNVDSIFVASVVTWTDSRCNGGSMCHEVSLTSCFANLNYIEAP